MNENWLAPQKISTPNLIADIEKYLGKELHNRYKDLDNSNQNRIEVLVERIEFIEHLRVFAEFVNRNSFTKTEIIKTEKISEKETKTYSVTSFKFILYGKDLGGAQFDIEALIFYLLITCIDTIKGQPKHIEPFQWIFDSAEEFTKLTTEEFQAKIFEKREEYQDKFGLSRRFREAFTHDLDKTLAERLSKNLLVIKLDEQGLTKAKLQSWNNKTQNAKIKKIADVLYSIRSTYSHASIRTFLPRQPIETVPELKGEYLLCKEGENFILLMLDIIKFLMHKHIK